jgi:hypothetical protein
MSTATVHCRARRRHYLSRLHGQVFAEHESHVGRQQLLQHAARPIRFLLCEAQVNLNAEAEMTAFLL